VTRGRTLAWALFSVGVTAIVGQILLIRELLATLYGNELLFGTLLAAWLGWGALGAGLAVVGRRASAAPGASPMAAGLAAAALLLPAQLALVRGLRAVLGATPGSMLDLGSMVLAVVLLLAPLCLCLGALFAAGTRALVEGGGTPGWAYVWDSIGAVTGGVLFSFVFVRWLNPFQTAFLIGGFDLAVAALVLICSAPAEPAEPSGLPSAGSGMSASRLKVVRRPIFPLTLVAVFTLVVLTIAAFPLGRAAQTATLRLQWPDASSGTSQSLLFSGDSPYGRLAVQAQGNQRIFYTDGALAFETQSTAPEEVAHLALLAHPSPREVLLIGGGIAGDLREILKEPVDMVTYVELDPLLIETARVYLPAADAAVLDDPRVRTVLTDGRAFVAQRPGPSGLGRPGPSYDAIIMDLPEPTTGAVNRFYTEEFFAGAQKLLRPGGILSFRLPSAENYWNPELARRNASIYRTLGSVFPSVTVLPGELDLFLAGNGPTEVDAGVMSERLTQRGIQTRWVTPAYLQDLLTGDRFTKAQTRLAGETRGRINRDLLPVSYYFSLTQWFARFYPRAGHAYEGITTIRLWWLALPLALAVLLARWRRRLALSTVVATVGLAQMLLELVLLFAFQALHGSLYAEVGLIVTAFMAGLALGGALSNQAIAHSGQASRPTVRQALGAVLAAMAAYGAVLPLIFRGNPATPPLLFPLLALLGGLLGGAVFPLAAALWTLAPAAASAGVAGYGSRSASSSGSGQPPPAAGGILYSADLAGGCLGALLGAVLFIPILGIPQTCAAIATLALAGLIAVL
jgi:spermidine synthase